jgi:hypothetical protein
MTTFEFHSVGSATLNVMFGAPGSTGAMVPVTRQYSGIAAAPVPLDAVKTAVVTVPPEVGRAITEAGIDKPANAAQADVGVGFPAAAAAESSAGATGLSLPPQAESKAATAQLAYNEALHFPFILSPMFVAPGRLRMQSHVGNRS